MRIHRRVTLHFRLLCFLSEGTGFLSEGTGFLFEGTEVFYQIFILVGQSSHFLFRCRPRTLSTTFTCGPGPLPFEVGQSSHFLFKCLSRSSLGPAFTCGPSPLPFQVGQSSHFLFKGLLPRKTRGPGPHAFQVWQSSHFLFKGRSPLLSTAFTCGLGPRAFLAGGFRNAILIFL